jgi:hypothetical protein
MGLGYDGSQGHHQEPQVPSPFFDGMRLGLEGAMFATLAVAIPAALQVGLSATLGYAVRYASGLPSQAKSVSLSGFIFPALLAFIGLSMAIFFSLAMPTMLYSAGLVAFMLRWLEKRRGHIKRASIILGSVLGLLVGLLISATGFLVLDLGPSLGNYGTFFRWPEILTFEGISLLWLTLLPVATAAAGAQTGRKLAQQLEALTMHWFWY